MFSNDVSQPWVVAFEEDTLLLLLGTVLDGLKDGGLMGLDGCDCAENNTPSLPALSDESALLWALRGFWNISTVALLLSTQ